MFLAHYKIVPNGYEVYNYYASLMRVVNSNYAALSLAL
jgi:hypothetical protein